MQQYLDLMRRVRTEGVRKTDRTGTGTLSVFGHQMRFDLAEGFPLVTTKKVHLKSIVHELIWFLAGRTSTAYLKLNRVGIWDEWAEGNLQGDGCGDLGPVYGKQWRAWQGPSSHGFERLLATADILSLEAEERRTPKHTRLQARNRHGRRLDTSYARYRVRFQSPASPHAARIRAAAGYTTKDAFSALTHIRDEITSMSRPIDQIQEAVETLKTNPDSRRIIVTAWNPADIPDMALAPCHCLFQFYVADGRLSCQLYQRSADVFLGVPFNIASYALLTIMMAQVTGLKPGDFVHTFGDAHLYLNHLEQADRQLSRTPRALPRMEIDPSVRSIFQFKYEHFKLTGYDPHPHIKAEVAV